MSELAYLMHEDKRSLKGIVDLFKGRVRDALSLHLFASQLEVVVPQLVTERDETRIIIVI